MVIKLLNVIHCRWFSGGLYFISFFESSHSNTTTEALSTKLPSRPPFNKRLLIEMNWQIVGSFCHPINCAWLLIINYQKIIKRRVGIWWKACTTSDCYTLSYPRLIFQWIIETFPKPNRTTKRKDCDNRLTTLIPGSGSGKKVWMRERRWIGLWSTALNNVIKVTFF